MLSVHEHAQRVLSVCQAPSPCVPVPRVPVLGAPALSLRRLQQRLQSKGGVRRVGWGWGSRDGAWGEMGLTPPHGDGPPQGVTQGMEPPNGPPKWGEGGREPHGGPWGSQPPQTKGTQGPKPKSGGHGRGISTNRGTWRSGPNFGGHTQGLRAPKRGGTEGQTPPDGGREAAPPNLGWGGDLAAPTYRWGHRIPWQCSPHLYLGAPTMPCGTAGAGGGGSWPSPHL